MAYVDRGGILPVLQTAQLFGEGRAEPPDGCIHVVMGSYKGQVVILLNLTFYKLFS